MTIATRRIQSSPCRKFEPPERIFLDKAKGFYIQKYVSHGGIGICDLVLIYSLVPAYITVRGVAVPALREKMLRD